MGEQLGFCDFVDVLIDVFDILGVPAVGYADGLLLEDGTVQKRIQIIRTLVAFVGVQSQCFIRTAEMFFIYRDYEVCP